MKPEVAAKSPAVVELEPGTYYWCSCGRSARQPFCDGSHAGTGFGPVKIEVTEARKMAFCQCKASGKGHLCDGSHRNL
jgi:CDGSH-type Zn-finger protein